MRRETAARGARGTVPMVVLAAAARARAEAMTHARVERVVRTDEPVPSVREQAGASTSRLTPRTERETTVRHPS